MHHKPMDNRYVQQMPVGCVNEFKPLPRLTYRFVDMGLPERQFRWLGRLYHILWLLLSTPVSPSWLWSSLISPCLISQKLSLTSNSFCRVFESHSTACYMHTYKSSLTILLVVMHVPCMVIAETLKLLLTVLVSDFKIVIGHMTYPSAVSLVPERLNFWTQKPWLTDWLGLV